MKPSRLRRDRDPRLSLSTVAKLDRLERRMQRLIDADIQAYDERLRVAASAAAGDGVPRAAHGGRDRRTSAYRRWRAARDASAAATESGTASDA
jgi:hypothetical protein